MLTYIVTFWEKGDSRKAYHDFVDADSAETARQQVTESGFWKDAFDNGDVLVDVHAETYEEAKKWDEEFDTLACTM